MPLSPEAIRFALLTRFLKGQAKVPATSVHWC
jgi:hypothetical protein